MNVNELRGVIVARGKTQKDVAKKLGIAEKTFSEKMKRGVFGSDEIDIMIDYIDIDNHLFIFFNR